MKKITIIASAIVMLTILMVVVACPTEAPTAKASPFGDAEMHVRGEPFDVSWGNIEGTSDMTWNGSTMCYEVTATGLTAGTLAGFKFAGRPAGNTSDDWFDEFVFGGQETSSAAPTSVSAVPVYLGWQGHPYWEDIADVNRSNLEAVIPADGNYVYTLDLSGWVEYTLDTDPTDDTGAAYGSVVAE